MDAEKLYYEDIEVGKPKRFGTYAVTRAEIIEMAERWDPQPFHLDDEVAKNSVFGEISACTVHIIAMQSAIAHQNPEPVAVLAGLGVENLQLRKAVKAGDTLSLETMTLDKRLSASKPDRGILKTQMRLMNQNDEIVMEQTGNVLVHKRET